MSNPSISGPGDGFRGPKNWDERMTNNSGSAYSKGDVVQIDESVVDSTTLAQTDIEDITAVGAEMGTIGVCLEDIADGATGMVRFRGRVDAQTTGTPAVGTLLMADGIATASNTLIVSAGTGKIVAKCIETGTTTPTLVIFDGVNGFGVDHA